MIHDIYETSSLDACRVYTPARLTAAIIAAIGGGASKRWLEPSFGRGAFLRAIAAKGTPATKVWAIDIDPRTHPNDRLATTQRAVDFLGWAQKTHLRFDAIVGNPPYLPLLDVAKSIRRAALNVSLPNHSVTIPVTGNLWAAFVTASVGLLAPGGSMAFILPAAWDYADYAIQLRSVLPSLFSEWFSLRSAKPLFATVQEGCVIVLGRGFSRPPKYSARLSCSNIAEACVKLRTLNAVNGRSNGRSYQKGYTHRSGATGQRLGDIVRIRLGGVTGDAGYFLLRESQRQELHLPVSALRPVLSKASHLVASVIDKTAWLKLRDTDARVWLFRPSGRALKIGSVRDYIALGQSNGGCDKRALKVKNRKPWYKVPLPHRVDGFISGMSKAGPWIALRGMPGLSASNTLYTVTFRRPHSDREKRLVALALLCTPVAEQLNIVCRRYAGGLRKFEPSDLQGLRLPPLIAKSDPGKAHDEAVRYLQRGELRAARIAADSCFGI